MRRFMLLVALSACAGAPRRDDVKESDLSYLDSDRPFADAPKAGAAPRPVPMVEGDLARSDVIEALAAGPADVLGAFDVRPEVRLGKFHGWEIAHEADPSSRFAGVDLRAGDVVLNVNGRSIEKPQEFYAVWQELRVAPELVIAVERGGVRRELHFHIHDETPRQPAPSSSAKPEPPAPPTNAVKSGP
jgi:hypothetical protein